MTSTLKAKVPKVCEDYDEEIDSKKQEKIVPFKQGMISVSGELSVTSYTGFGRATDPANFLVTELYEGD